MPSYEELQFDNLDIATGEQKDSIEQVSKLGIGASTKAELVLVILGLAKATEIDVYKWNDDPGSIRGVVESSGLVVRERPVQGDNENVVTSFIVAKTPELLERFAELDPSEDHGAYGKFMGFPETAVSAFLNDDELLPDDEYPDGFDRSIILPFRLSKKGKEQELRVLEYRTGLVKKYAPEVYTELVGEDAQE